MYEFVVYRPSVCPDIRPYWVIGIIAVSIQINLRVILELLKSGFIHAFVKFTAIKNVAILVLENSVLHDSFLNYTIRIMIR